MTRREKILATTLLVALLVLGGGVLAHLFVIEPLGEVRGELLAAREALQKKKNELATEEKQIENILRVNPRLTQWPKISLPPRDPEKKKQVGVPLEDLKIKHLRNMGVEYDRYLSDLMRKNGIKDVLITRPQPDRRIAVPLKGNKEPLYERLAFAASGKGSYEGVVQMLREIHQTPLLHQVRSVTVGLASTRGEGAKSQTSAGTLEVSLLLEALLVGGAEERQSLLPSKLAYEPRVLADPRRDYAQMAKRSMFTGVTPPRPPQKEKEKEPARRSTEERAEVLRFVRLTMIWYNPQRDRWEATLYDQAKGGAEIPLNTGVRNEFTIRDKDKNKILEAKVKYLDERQMVIQEEKKYYRVFCGDFLYPLKGEKGGVNDPLTAGELKKLGIEPEPEKKKEDTTTTDKDKDKDKDKEAGEGKEEEEAAEAAKY